MYAVIRTYSAGVHVGTIVRREGKEVELADARRIWSWKEANTLSEISLRGVGRGSKISESVPRIILTEAIEIIPASDECRKSLEAVGWSK